MQAIVARAKANGITHVYPRMGSHWDGFNARQHMDAFLPVAHAAGLKVFGWDFPRLGDSLPSDIERARSMINFTSSSGDRLDGFSADIETINEGSHVTPEIALVYGRALRDIAGPDFTLIATVPRPSPRHRPTYPYGEIVESFDAIAPMVYWLNRQPDTDVIGAMDELAKFGKPIFPVGQAYDGKPEGGRAGVPPPEELLSFMRSALDKGATGVSFWSWQAANGAAWSAIRDASEFSAPLVTRRSAAESAARPRPRRSTPPESKRHNARSRRLRPPSAEGIATGAWARRVAGEPSTVAAVMSPRPSVTTSTCSRHRPTPTGRRPTSRGRPTGGCASRCRRPPAAPLPPAPPRAPCTAARSPRRARTEPRRPTPTPGPSPGRRGRPAPRRTPPEGRRGPRRRPPGPRSSAPGASRTCGRPTGPTSAPRASGPGAGGRRGRGRARAAGRGPTTAAQYQATPSPGRTPRRT